MHATRRLSIQQARWLAIDAQGLAGHRPLGRVDKRHLRLSMGMIGALQLDAINVLERTQFIALFSRLGGYDVQRLHDMTGPGGELFEYWGHAASLLLMSTQPLFRWRMEQHGTSEGGTTQYAAAWNAWAESHSDYIAAVLEEIAERGPLPASALSDPRRREGEWWERRSVGRQALEWLFTKGELAAWRTRNFERIYDLPDRVIPKEVLREPTPRVDEAHRLLLVSAAGSLGVATIGDLADYYRIKPRDAKLRVAELVTSGTLAEVSVESWRQPAYCHPDVRPRLPRRSHATLLSPFDSLIWQRERTRRLFGFDYRIEVYVPQPQRRYGYYVLPLLLGDELVARFDLKADRKASTLRVSASWVEPGADTGTVAAAAGVELDAMRRWLGLDDTAVGRRGNLATALRRSIG